MIPVVSFGDDTGVVGVEEGVIVDCEFGAVRTRMQDWFAGAVQQEVIHAVVDTNDKEVIMATFGLEVG